MSELPVTSPRYAAETMGRMRRLHFVGIGGAGMNGIAQVMLNLGYMVSGSDIKQNAATLRLAEQGARIHIGHSAEFVADADAVVISSAVKDDNPEVGAARERRIPVVPRAEMLAEIMRFRYGIAVAGTHGKTTTTSLIASLLIEGGLDPTYVIGGRLNARGSNAHLGEGEVLVAEADESDASFLFLQPMLAVVTNVDEDHMGTYGNDFGRLRAAFLEFLHHLPFYGQAVLCVDDANVCELLPEVTRKVVTYGTSEEADIRATDIRQQAMTTEFSVQRSGAAPFPVRLNMPGRHNVLNALAAIAVAQELGVEVPAIQAALAAFQGIGRRFQARSGCRIGGREVMLVDDYGHHPRELSATLEAVRSGWPQQRVVLAFQPHRYTRTHDAFDDFVAVLSSVDVLVLAEVYAAGEAPIAGADGRALSRAIRARGQVDPIFVEQVEDLPQILADIVADGDIVVTMGAGNIGAVAANMAEALCP
ncbi:MAG: UDP-N-acetylmuramate--L-alanine ligase [Gammaproteobacteria bacterium]|nr:UDP-N-acetylmuramate--L-alanine ligase [Gammaproteobacteria bacterium]